jgi:hypothetical protein
MSLRVVDGDAPLPKRICFIEVKEVGTLFRYGGKVCMSLGWPSGDNNVHYIELEGAGIGSTSSHHNGSDGIEAILAGELLVHVVRETEDHRKAHPRT